MDFSNFLATKEIQGIPVGSKKYFAIQKKLIKERKLMRYHYDLWYDKLLSHAKNPQLEIGSGGSFLKEKNKKIITSDVVKGLAERTIDARKLPFRKNSLGAIHATHVFHHIPDAEQFLKEVQRTLKKGGTLNMIETTNTLFARFFYTHLHPEPHEPNAGWSFKWKHNMHDSNQALSWIVFIRDKKIFEKKFSNLKVETIEYLPWFSYVCSGGITRKQLVPNYLSWIPLTVDWLMAPFKKFFSLSWYVRIRKV